MKKVILRKLRQEDIKIYIGILLRFLLIFPLIHTFWILEFGWTLKAHLITFSMLFVVWILSIHFFNYLEHGQLKILVNYLKSNNYYVRKKIECVERRS